MRIHIVAFAVVTVLPLVSCHEPTPSDVSNVVSVRLHGEGKLGSACEAQSECGYRQRCVYRGENLMSKALVVQKGVCEPTTYPGGCFGLLPPYRFSEAEIAEMRRDERKNLHVICE